MVNMIFVIYINFRNFDARFDYRQCQSLQLDSLHFTQARLTVQRKYFWRRYLHW